MGLLGSLFGGSKSKSGNDAYPFLSGQLQAPVTSGVNAFNHLGDAVGTFADYSKNAGLDFAGIQGSRAITGNAAAKGLLNSGSTAKGLTSFASGLNSQFYNNWLDKLGGVVDKGQGYAQILAGSGQKSKGSSNGGILSSLFG